MFVYAIGVICAHLNQIENRKIVLSVQKLAHQISDGVSTIDQIVNAYFCEGVEKLGIT